MHKVHKYIRIIYGADKSLYICRTFLIAWLHYHIENIYMCMSLHVPNPDYRIARFN